MASAICVLLGEKVKGVLNFNQEVIIVVTFVKYYLICYETAQPFAIP